MAACIRWLGENGYNNEGAGGHVTVRDPIKPDHFWCVASGTVSTRSCTDNVEP
jgi:ribulose-5-phosphate 4-epimerase/fuculose-1-phosphate aldolase